MIETDRLILRNWRPEDHAPFLAHTNTPAVMRWLGGMLSPDDAAGLLARMTRWQEERGYTFWVVERRAGQGLLGFCGLKIADAPNSTVTGACEIGWRLREDAWGQGYAKEAATASLDFAFGRLGVPSVVAITITGNAPSWGLMEKLGMTRRPDLDYDDPRFEEARPAIVYSLEASQWRS